ncbi:hypothetical protein Ddye_006775 [Dipteronia dyeriana]|uniref:Uncharacterized protein n=1 Tax=Dipteronia dyeriana TaxID=168575 RepID=A0AAD9XJA2_9ROSI|nr:hypothetical protein Ddye_006775 [Dipteronia dyeriana]
MKAMNQALLAKVGWRLLHNNTGLWGSLLKDKYLKVGNMFDYGNLTNNNCSGTWGGVLFGAKLLLDVCSLRKTGCIMALSVARGDLSEDITDIRLLPLSFLSVLADLGLHFSSSLNVIPYLL